VKGWHVGTAAQRLGRGFGVVVVAGLCAHWERGAAHLAVGWGYRSEWVSDAEAGGACVDFGARSPVSVQGFVGAG